MTKQDRAWRVGSALIRRSLTGQRRLLERQGQTVPRSGIRLTVADEHQELSAYGLNPIVAMQGIAILEVSAFALPLAARREQSWVENAHNRPIGSSMAVANDSRKS